MPDNDQFSPKKMDIGQSINATSVNEFEVTKEIQRIKSLKKPIKASRGSAIERFAD